MAEVLVFEIGDKKYLELECAKRLGIFNSKRPRMTSQSITGTWIECPLMFKIVVETIIVQMIDTFNSYF